MTSLGLSGSPQNNNANYFKTPVNNAILDPMQGFDADVWVLDQGTGNFNLVGRFTSLQLTIRNATEPYLEMNQRVPRLLDGEFQFGWVLERGMLDSRVLEQTFGYNAITRELRNNRNVRFQISFSINAPELQDSSNPISTNGAGITGPTSTAAGGNGLGDPSNPFSKGRHAYGEYLLTFCKVDSFTIGINAGRNVIANRWEGMCEGIEYINRSKALPGVFLSSERADVALDVSARAAGTIDPFPWDKVLYSANSGNSLRVRSTNPLSTSVSTNPEIAGRSNT